MLDDRYFQPALIWGHFRTWLDRTISETDRSDRPRLYIFRTDQPGAYYLHNPRLYWDEVVGDPYWAKCDQDQLLKHRDALGEVQAHVYHQPHCNPIQWASFEEFLTEIAGLPTTDEQ